MNAKRLCLVHGWGAGSKKLEPLKEELQKLGWEIFLPKLPFFDLPEPKTPWQLEDFCRYLDDKAREFFKNKSYSLFGHSFGGRIGLKMALENKNQAKLNSPITWATFKAVLAFLAKKISSIAKSATDQREQISATS